MSVILNCVEVIFMGVNHFCAKQIEELSSNPYIISVSDKSIHYSQEFKELFYIDYCNGMSPSMIFAKYGIDPKILGRKRRDNFVQRMKMEASRNEGFTDTRKNNSGRPAEKELTQDEIVQRLKQKNRILQQENDFLKRVRYINRKQILSQSKIKHQKKNSD